MFYVLAQTPTTVDVSYTWGKILDIRTCSATAWYFIKTGDEGNRKITVPSINTIFI